jgi:hypothetical protein
MHSLAKATAFAIGMAAIVAPAFGQRPPPAPYQPHPVLSADLGEVGNEAFTGVDNTDTGQLCYMLYAANVQNPTGAQIRDAKSGTPVVQLAVPAGGTSGGCANIGQDLAKKLVDHPGDYTVTVDSSAYPNGNAANGQLTASIPDKPVV